MPLSGSGTTPITVYIMVVEVVSKSPEGSCRLVDPDLDHYHALNKNRSYLGLAELKGYLCSSSTNPFFTELWWTYLNFSIKSSSSLIM
jgi:hypothetical protein